jgi:hypothetical protein
MRRDEHHASGGDAQQVHAPVCEPSQDIDDVVVIDEGVGHVHEGLDNIGFSQHHDLRSRSQFAPAAMAGAPD